MQSIKGFCSGGSLKNNRPLLDAVFLFIGIFGGLFLIYGLLMTSGDTSRYYYVIGSSLLLATALHYQITYFIVLETILLSGHGSVLLGLNHLISITLPILLCVQFIIYTLLSGTLKNVYLLLGIIGISFISIAFIIHNQLIFFIGGFTISTYSFYLFHQGRKIALLWAINNGFFALIALLDNFQDLIW